MTAALLIDDFEATRLLAISKRRLSAMVRKSQIPFVRLPSGDIRFVETELLRWIKQQQQGQK
jgi:excisionase family DNA binding protein